MTIDSPGNKIFFGKFIAGITYLALFTVISIFSIFPLAKAYNISYQSEGFYKLALVGFLLGLAIFGLSLLFSAIFSEKSKPTFIVVGILILMYFLNIISGLKDNLKNLKYLSFFYYYKPSDILSYNKIDHLTWWVFIGTFVVIWFNKRDIAI